MKEHIDTATVQADFDRIALFSNKDVDEGWNHNNHYHRFLLDQVPARCTEALDIGCGAGQFARLLASRAEHVLALDLSPQMIRSAEARAAMKEHGAHDSYLTLSEVHQMCQDLLPDARVRRHLF